MRLSGTPTASGTFSFDVDVGATLSVAVTNYSTTISVTVLPAPPTANNVNQTVTQNSAATSLQKHDRFNKSLDRGQYARTRHRQCFRYDHHVHQMLDIWVAILLITKLLARAEVLQLPRLVSLSLEQHRPFLQQFYGECQLYKQHANTNNHRLGDKPRIGFDTKPWFRNVSGLKHHILTSSGLLRK